MSTVLRIVSARKPPKREKRSLSLAFLEADGAAQEAERLADAMGIALADFARAVNPFHFAAERTRGGSCTLVRLVGYNESRVVTAVDLYVNAMREMVLRHTIIPTLFKVYVLRGRVVMKDGSGGADEFEEHGIAEVNPWPNGYTVSIDRGTQLIYVEHPLTAWMRHKSRALIPGRSAR